MTRRKSEDVIVKLLAIVFCVSVIFSTISMNVKSNTYENYYDVTSQQL